MTLDLLNVLVIFWRATHAFKMETPRRPSKLEALYQRAVEDHHFHAGVRAVEAQARIAGHVARRAALPVPGMTANDDFPASAQDGNETKSIGCANRAAGNDDFRTTR